MRLVLTLSSFVTVVAITAITGLVVLGESSAPGAEGTEGEGLRVVAIDPGHGGSDHGALGAGGLQEKDIVLQVSRQLGRELEGHGLRVVFTRSADAFVTLAERADIANRGGANLYLSIHANSAPNGEARGPETYFLSLEASDEEAMRVAITENQVFKQEGAVDDSGDIVGNILGDLILTDHLRHSSGVAAAIQRHLARLRGPSRGVKQAPFAVLMGVNMPAVLVEIGFLTHPEEGRSLRTPAYQQRVAGAIAEAVREYAELRYGESAEEASP